MSVVSSIRPKGQGAAQPGKYSSYVLGLMLIFSLVGPLLSLGGQAFTGEGNPMRQALWILSLVGAILASRAYAHPRRLLVVPLPIMATLLWCVISMTWAIAPDVAIRRLIFTMMITWSVFIAVESAGYERSMAALRVILVVVLVANFIAVAIIPGLAIHHAVDLSDPKLVGDWRGILPHKNYAGPACAFTVIYFGLGRPKLRWAGRIAIMLAATVFLYKTGSKTSMGFTAFALVAGWLFERYDPRYRGLILPGLAIVISLATLLFWQMMPDLLAPLSRPEAFTGRGMIWPVLLKYSSDHLITGSGYGSFWNIGADSPSFYLSRGWVAHMASGHNGYLDMLAQVGVPGLALMVLSGFIIPMIKLFASRGFGPDRGGLLLGSLLFCAGHNFTETSLFDRDATVQVFLMITVALIYIVTRGEAREPARSAAARPPPRPKLRVRRSA